MNGTTHPALTSKALRTMEEKENARCSSRKEANASGKLFNKIETTTEDIADQFYDLIHYVQMREQVPLEIYRDENALTRETEHFAALKSKIATRDALFDEFKKVHEPAKPAKKTRMSHDPKNGLEPVNLYTQAASTMLQAYMENEQFHHIKDDLEEIFDLLGIQSTRHVELQKQKEHKILEQNLELEEYKRELKKTKRELSSSEKETTMVKSELATSRKETAELTAYVESLSKRILEQKEETNIWNWEKQDFKETINNLRTQVKEASSSSTELQTAKKTIVELEKQARAWEVGSAPKGIEILKLKNSLAAKNKEVITYKNSAGGKDESIKAITKQLKGKNENIAMLRQELGVKEYEIQSLKTDQQSSLLIPDLNQRSNANESVPRRRIEDMKRDQTQATKTKPHLLDKNNQHQDTIQTLKYQLSPKDSEIKRLRTEVNDLCQIHKATDSVYRERR